MSPAAPTARATHPQGRPLRVAYLINVFPKLSETFIANELAELRRRGVDLRVLSLRQPEEGLRHGFIEDAGLEQLTCRDHARFEAVLRDFQPDLLHAHFATEPTEAARHWSQRLDVPYTFTAHGYDIRRKPPADFAERALQARALVTVSEANLRHIVETFGVPAGHIRIIPCGVDTERFAPAPAPARGPADAPLILAVARHVKVKNLSLLLEACGLLRDRRVAFRCALIGDGPLRPELEQQHATLGLGAAVRFLGALAQEEVLGWWQRADVATLTSENEGMPVALMEAAACGVPAVATAVGGIPELVQPGITGLLATPGDPASLADAFQALLQDPKRRQAMSKAARARAQQRFSLAGQIDALLALWQEVLA
jgi:glycosyltransferase involved in cell wall biosynthesis